MKRKLLRRWLLGTVAALFLIGTCLSAFAARNVGDLDGDGKVTAFDAQLIAEANAGKRELNEEQQLSAKGLSVREIIDVVLGKIVLPTVQEGGYLPV